MFLAQKEDVVLGPRPGLSTLLDLHRAGFAIPEFLDLGQVAAALRVSSDDVLSIIESGELSAKKIGSAYRIKRSALEAYLAD